MCGGPGHSERSVSRGPRRNIALLVSLGETGKLTDSLSQNLSCGPTDLLIILRGMYDLVRLPSAGCGMIRSIQGLRPGAGIQQYRTHSSKRPLRQAVIGTCPKKWDPRGIGSG